MISECREFGLGSQLLEHVKARLVLDFPSCKALYLHVISFNEKALKFYGKLNFV